jgi:hypothetical protein
MTPDPSQTHREGGRGIAEEHRSEAADSDVEPRVATLVVRDIAKQPIAFIRVCRRMTGNRIVKFMRPFRNRLVTRSSAAGARGVRPASDALGGEGTNRHVAFRFMSPIGVRDFGEPEAVVTYPLGATYQVRLAGTVISRHVLQPGWSWEKHAKPMVGTASCELYHRGVVVRGRMGVRTDEGEVVIIEPNQVFDLMPRHVTWVEGDEELEMVDWAGGAGFDPRPVTNGAPWPRSFSPTSSTPRCWHAMLATWHGNEPWPCTTTSSAACSPVSAAER